MNLVKVAMILVLALTISCTVINKKEGKVKNVSSISHSFILCSEEPENSECIEGWRDCKGEYNGNAQLDECGVCEGNNETCTDCHGILFGTGVLDQCGECDGNNDTCTIDPVDCAGTPNGTAQLDRCGVCDGDGNSCPLPAIVITNIAIFSQSTGTNTGLVGKVGDTLRIYGSNLMTAKTSNTSPKTVLFINNVSQTFTYNSALNILVGTIPAGALGNNYRITVYNAFGVGVLAPVSKAITVSSNVVVDCNGEPDGPAVLDVCGVCDGDGNSCIDCDNVPNGGNFSCVDCNGEMHGSDFVSCADCSGEPNGGATVDVCGVCGGDDSSCSDCKGVLFGTSEVDACGVCGGNSDSCPIDCNGEAYGTAVVDECYVCTGDNSSCKDCEGTIWGDAELDLCNVCRGDSSTCALIQIASISVKTPGGQNTGLLGRAGDTLQIFGTGFAQYFNLVKFNNLVVSQVSYSPSLNALVVTIPLNVEGANTISVIGINGVPSVATQILTVNSSATGGQIVPGNPNITNCITHAGQPYPWEGTGICTANAMIEIPIGATEQMLIQNSVMPSGDFGFGPTGFRLSIDKRILKTGSVLRTSEGDGSEVTFQQLADQTWTAVLKQLSKSKIKADGAQLKETLKDGTVLTYSPLASNVNTFVLISTVSLNGQSIFLQRNSVGNITRIYNEFQLATDRGVRIGYNPTGARALSVTDVDGNPYTLTYDTSGKLKKAIYPDLTFWQITYASTNRIVTLKAPNGGSTLLGYTTEGLLSQVTDPDGRVVKYTYSSGAVSSKGVDSNVDEQVNLSGAVIRSSVENSVSEMSYDSLKQLITSKDNDGNITSYKYENQLLTQINLPNGNKVNYSYNSNGNITSEIMTGNGVTLAINYLYNSDNQITAISGPGTYSKVFTYDDKHNINSISENLRLIRSIVYNTDNTISSVTIDGKITSYGYDNYGHVNSVTEAGSTTTITSTPSGLPLSITKPNYTETYVYDNMGRIVKKTVSSPGSNHEPYTVDTEYTATSTVRADKNGFGSFEVYQPDGHREWMKFGPGYIGQSNGTHRIAPTYINP